MALGRLKTTAAVAALAAVVLSGCGGGSDDSKDASAGTSDTTKAAAASGSSSFSMASVCPSAATAQARLKLTTPTDIQALAVSGDGSPKNPGQCLYTRKGMTSTPAKIALIEIIKTESEAAATNSLKHNGPSSGTPVPNLGDEAVSQSVGTNRVAFRKGPFFVQFSEELNTYDHDLAAKAVELLRDEVVPKL